MTSKREAKRKRDRARRSKGSTLRDGLKPVAGVLEQAAASVATILSEAKPAEGSPAHAELAVEAPFRTNGQETPLTNSRSYAIILGLASTDAARAVAHHMRHPDLLIWAPYVNARAGLDAAGFAYWLTESEIGAEARVQRGMTLRLQNGREMKRAPAELGDARTTGKGVVADVKAKAVALAWEVSGKDNRARVGNETLPYARDVIDRVLRYRQGPEHETVADVSWWFYSGLTHATPYALMQFVERSEARPFDATGMAEAPVYISGPGQVTAAAALGRAVLNLGQAYGHYLGADTSLLMRVDAEFARVILGTLEAMGER